MNVSDKRIIDILGRYHRGTFAVTVALDAKLSRREAAKMLSRLYRSGKVQRVYNTTQKSFEYRIGDINNG